MNPMSKLSVVVAVAVAGCAAKLPSSLNPAPRLEGQRSPVEVGTDAVSVGAGDPQAPTYQQTVDAEVAQARRDPDRGTCTAENLVTARQQGLTGPCWDPPGREAFAAPVHVVPGLRQMADDLWWFDMPREGEVDPNTRCPLLPAAGDGTYSYDPYSDEGGQPAPAIPAVTGMTVAQALAALDRLDAPLCVQLITWTTSCPQPEGHVCQQNFDDRYAQVNLIVRGPDE